MTKTDFDNKLISLAKIINSNETKHLLVEDQFKKLQAFDSTYFRGKSHFEEVDAQHYFITSTKKISGVGDGEYIYFGNVKVCLMKGLILLLHLIIYYYFRIKLL